MKALLIRSKTEVWTLLQTKETFGFFCKYTNYIMLYAGKIVMGLTVLVSKADFV